MNGATSKRLCETGSLVIFRERTMLWEFPSEFLRCFSKVTIATYMFDASPFAAYLKNESFTFNRQTVNGNLITPALVPWESAKFTEAALKARLRERQRHRQGASALSPLLGRMDWSPDR